MIPLISEIIEDTDIYIIFEGIKLTPFPTKDNFIGKYVEIEIKDEIMEKYFLKTEKLTLVFADILELSYHNFENIINIDHIFNQEYEVKNEKKIKKGIISFDLTNTKELLDIDKLNLYTVPLNKNSRGGHRMIFKFRIVLPVLFLVA